jgi:sulfate transport system permease protein
MNLNVLSPQQKIEADSDLKPGRDNRHKKKANKVPYLKGEGWTRSFTLFYLTVLVLIPLGALIYTAIASGWGAVWAVWSDSRVLHALWLSTRLAFVGALLALISGGLLAWVLARYRFVGRSLLDAALDLPFAMPTAVLGIALTSLYQPNTWMGQALEHIGISVAFTPIGILLALWVVGLPFVVRSLQPVLASMDHSEEEAAQNLGATASQRFWRVIIPHLYPACISGFALAFARGLGEYGSVIFIAGNIPFETEIAPLLIVGKLEQFDLQGAAAIGFALLLIALLILIAIYSLSRTRWFRLGRLS